VIDAQSLGRPQHLASSSNFQKYPNAIPIHLPISIFADPNRNSSRCCALCTIPYRGDRDKEDKMKSEIQHYNGARLWPGRSKKFSRLQSRELQRRARIRLCADRTILPAAIFRKR
jgi:hypothetical protein